MKLKKIILRVMALDRGYMWIRSICDEVMDSPEVKPRLQNVEKLKSVFGKKVIEDFQYECKEKIYSVLKQLRKKEYIEESEDGHGFTTYKITKLGKAQTSLIPKKEKK